MDSDFTFYDYLINQGYLFDKETIENYLLSLKVKPFAILTGNSGTGKTKLSQLFAQYLSLEDIEYQEEEIESSDNPESDMEIEGDDDFDSPIDNTLGNVEGGYFAEYSKEIKQSFINEGKFQISSMYPFKEYYGKCFVELNGESLEANIRSENIIIFKNSPEIRNYLSNNYNSNKSRINFKINSTDVSKAIIEDYVPKRHVLEGEVTKTVFNRIKLPINRKDSFPGTTSDFYPIKYEVPCRVIVDNKVEGVCTLRSYAWIELANKNSFQVESLKNQDSFYLKLFLDTFEYNQNQITDFSTVGDYIDFKSFKKNLDLDLSDNKLDEELNNKIKKIFNFEDDFDKDSLNEIKELLNLTGYESEEELIKKFSDAMNKKKDSTANDSSNKEDFDGDSTSNPSVINENMDSKTIKYKKIVNYNTSDTNYKIIPVGANWTENRHIVGYYNVITNEYQDTPAYNLIKHAEGYGEPHFLILDEMNLSHVERYFADFLSAIESGEKIPLYGEEELTLPPNLFIIGTVNVDETTYMFSPKVLDRANVIEFETYSASDYMNNKINLEPPSGNTYYLENLLEDSYIRQYGIDELRGLFQDVKVEGEPFWNLLTDEIFAFQEILKDSGFDFGFRVINEIVRFMAVAWKYEYEPTEFDNWTRYFDACIKQKMLPKLHGSEKIIGQTLKELFNACVGEHYPYGIAKYPESAHKSKEMREVLRKQRYVSFIN